MSKNKHIKITVIIYYAYLQQNYNKTKQSQFNSVLSSHLMLITIPFQLIN